MDHRPLTETQLGLPELRHLCRQLAIWAFTDFEQARETLATLKLQINPDTSFDVRLAYHRHAAFLENQWQRYPEAIQHLDQASDILEKLSDLPKLAELWTDRAAIFLNQRNWNAVEECLEQARSLVKGRGSAKLRIHIACREGFLQLHLHNDRQALSALLEARKLLENIGEQAGLKERYIHTLVLSGLGDVYERLEDKEQSLDAYRRVLPIAEEFRLRPRLAWHYLNAGKAALAQQDVQEAWQHFEKAEQVSAEGDQEAKAYALANLGILSFVYDQTEQSGDYFDRALALFQSPKRPADFANRAKLEFWLAGILIRRNDLDQAETRLQSAYDYGLKGTDSYHQRQICQTLAELYGQRKNFTEAYRWQTRALELADAHFLEKQDYERQELEARYQLERNRQEARLARLQVVSLQMRALRAQMNPHFLFNVLNAIQGLITSGRNSEAETYLARFAKLIRQSLDYSDLEVVTLEQEMEFLGRYLELNKKLRFRDQLEFEMIPPANLDAEEIRVPTMIIQPFVENAIEHGLRPLQSGKLRISFQLTQGEKNLLCIIEDDGVGYNKGKEKQSQKAAFQSHRSRGLEITRERLSLLHQMQKTRFTGQTIRIHDLGERSNNQLRGTRVEVVVPLLNR